MTDPQQIINEHMRKIAHRVMDVFENAGEDTLADDIMPEVFAAIGLVEAYATQGTVPEVQHREEDE